MLDRIYSVRENFSEKYKELESSGVPESELKQLIHKAEQRNPIFLLGECIAEDWGPCLLSRQYAPKYRKRFEDKTVSTLIKRLESSATPVHYVSFACGGMFQDLVVITKTLAQKPDAALALHLIDLEHTPYVACRDFMELTREIRPTESVNPRVVIDQLITRAKEKWGVSENIEGDKLEETKQNLIDTCRDFNERPKQFISYLKRTFPNAQLSLYIHESSDSYLTYRQQHQLPYPDVVTTVDTQDEMSLIRHSPQHRADLCKSILTNNPTASTIHLEKETSRGPAILLSTSRKPKKGAIKESVGEGDEQIEVYCHTETL